MSDKYDNEVDFYDYIQLSKGLLPGRIAFLRDSFSRMDQLLGREIAREREKFEDDEKRNPQGIVVTSEESYEYQGERFVFESARFRRLIRQSNLVTICTFWESEFASITRELISKTNVRRFGNAPGLSIKEFRGNNVGHRCRTALTKYVGLADDELTWNDLTSFVKLRNTIVHEGDWVRTELINNVEVPSDKGLRDSHAKFKDSGLSFVDLGEMIVTPRLNDLYLTKVQEYLCDVMERAIDHFKKLRAV